jgi:hypothetical protein
VAAATANTGRSASEPTEREDRRQRTLESDLQKLRVVAHEAEALLRETIARAPYLTTAAAGGIGFLLGGGLPRGAVTLLLGAGARAGARLATAWLSQEILERSADNSASNETGSAQSMYGR